MELDPVDHAALVEAAQFVITGVHGDCDAGDGPGEIPQPGQGLFEGNETLRLRPEVDPERIGASVDDGDGLVGAGNAADFHGDASGILRKEEARRHV